MLTEEMRQRIDRAVKLTCCALAQQGATVFFCPIARLPSFTSLPDFHLQRQSVANIAALPRFRHPDAS